MHWSPPAIFAGPSVRALLYACLLVTVPAFAACDSDEKESPASEEEQVEASPAEKAAPEQNEPQDKAPGATTGEFRLGLQMNRLTRRFAAIWYAGQAGNKEMVDYQIDEIVELVKAMEPHAPTENDVKIVPRLKEDIVPALSDVSGAVGKGAEFEKAYRNVIQECESCHADTEHPYIKPTIPQYNPYPNISMTVQ